MFLNHFLGGLGGGVGCCILIDAWEISLKLISNYGRITIYYSVFILIDSSINKISLSENLNKSILLLYMRFIK